MKLHVSEGFSLPVSVADDVIAIVGRRGRGKTTTAAVIVEELHAAGARFCVCDPTDAWWGHKSSRDGKSPGIACVVMGGEHGDAPLAPDSGEIIADFVADPTSPSCVLELKSFTQGESVRFMTAFLARLYHKNAHPLHLVLDEADQFAPQRPMPGEQAMLGAAQRVTKMGRVKGLHPILITQRPATLSKNVLTQAGMLICHAITGPQDRKATDEWIKANAEEGEREKFLAELSGLPRGTAYFWSPDVPVFRQVAVRDRKTFDSSATPGHASARVQPKALAEVDLAALRTKISATIERAKADDPRELRKSIAELRAELAALKKAAPKIERIEVPFIPPSTRTLLKDAIAAIANDATKHIRAAIAEMDAAIHQDAPPYDDRPSSNGSTARATKPSASGVRRDEVPSPPHGRQVRVGSGAPSNGSLPAGERKILTAVAQHRGGVTREQLTILTGYKRSSRDTYLQRLASRGLVGFIGNAIGVREDGMAALGSDFERLPTGDALREYWLDRLPAGEKKLLEIICASYPGAVNRDDLSEATGYKRSSRDTYAQRLIARRLIEAVGRGELSARGELFE
jgi:hypothetical protein